MKKIKPLKRGSRIAVVSPSNGLPALFPHQFDKGLENLETRFGFEIVEMPTARMAPEELYRHPEKRAADLNAAFADDTIDGIICSIGGYESVRILKYLDVKTILAHPKLLMGFSDSTTFLTYLNLCGMVTFYGPSVMAGWAQIEHLPPEYAAHLEAMLSGPELPYRYEPYAVWSQQYKDWRDPAFAGELVEIFENTTGFDWLQGKHAVEGALWGGCIEVLENLKGTPYWPQEDFWASRILFLESSEEKPTPEQVGCFLRNYATQGILDRIGGLVIGRPKDYSPEEVEALRQIVTNILTIENDLSGLPVLMNVDFGHTDPKVVLPIGCRVRLDPGAGIFELLETPFVSQT